MKLIMQGRLDPCFLLSYALPVGSVGGLLPPGLYPLTYQGFAFLNIVVSRILKMRTAGLPSALGLTYWHIAYRLHASADLASGQTITGLYFLRSDVDRGLPVIPGNALTDFRFHQASIRSVVDQASIQLSVTRTPDAIADAGLAIQTTPAGEDQIAPPFRTIQEREQILKYAPFGLSVDRSGRWLKVAEVQREEGDWEERRVRVQTADWEYLKRAIHAEARLVRATQVMPIDYRWRIGRMEQL
jgi:uncharacterized protein YqjF (DUF2071 family)